MKLIYLEWEDAIGQSGWHTEEEFKQWATKDNTVCKQVGWVYKETKKYLILSSRLSLDNYAQKDSELQYGQLEKIPKTWIRKKKILKI
jgi:hypothetical protein